MDIKNPVHGSFSSKTYLVSSHIYNISSNTQNMYLIVALAYRFFVTIFLEVILYEFSISWNLAPIDLEPL